MKILILYHSDQFIDQLYHNLDKENYEISSFNIVSWRYRSNIKKKNLLIVKYLFLLMIIPKVRGLLIKLFRDKVLLYLSDKFSIIDIHFFSPVYDRLIEELKKRGKKIKITIWGSDFYRVDITRREQQRRIYKMVDIIQIETKQVLNDFLLVYPEYEEKVRIAHFGIRQFDIIDELLLKRDRRFYKKELKLPADMIIFTCGTNGSKGQRHLMILKSIEKLASEIKEQLFLLLPMTYGGTKSYIYRIKQKAESLGLPYKIISSFLTINNICKIRIVSDIIITIQLTDALASAIQEHMYTEEIMIAGEWLPYEVLNENEIFFLSTSLESLTEKISYTVKNFESLKKMCSGNNARLSNFSSWNKVIKDWLAIYNEMAVN